MMDKAMGNGLMQEENTAEGERYITKGMPERIRECGEEGIVLLKNEGALPLVKDEILSVYGRCQNDWFYVGYGSGGDVHPPYQISFMEGLEKQHIHVNETLANVYKTWCANPDNQADHGWWGHWPYFYEEMPLENQLVEEAAKKSKKATVIIGRAAGEDRENTLTEGSYYLTKQEKRMLELVCKYHEQVILIMNCGSIIDMSFVEKYKISAIVYAWQLGQESGNALAGVLSGAVNPSGKLADTIAKKYEDYPSSANFGKKEFNNYAEDIYVGYRFFDTFHPEKVLYPFGYGLSYTNFQMQAMGFVELENSVEITIEVKNVGKCAGKEVIQVYCKQPEGKLPKANKILVAFEKTKSLEAGEKQILTFTIPIQYVASYDDNGESGYASSFVLESGDYKFLIGNSIHATLEAGKVVVNKSTLVEQLHPVCQVDVNKTFEVMTGKGTKKVYVSKYSKKQRILTNLPKEIPYTGNKGIKLRDVVSGKSTMEEFVAQLTEKELSDLSHGEGGMGSSLGVTGNAGAFGGITEELRQKGIPAIITADGPAGLRIRRYTALLPCGTAIACTWNTNLVEKLFEKEGQEAQHFGVDEILSPGMNIHRNPLCGRNFEYYSEDPVLSGKIAAAAVRGIQKGGVSACPKHFACNNQEINRNHNDSRISERALREIYLRNFEICVKEGKPQNLMTSYNKINGVWSHYNYDLVTTVLRKEWGYQGNVVTDWWMRKSASPEFPKIKDNAYRVRAQVDVLMPGNMSYTKKGYLFDKQQLKTLGQKEGITRGELQRTAMNVLQFAMTRIVEE